LDVRDILAALRALASQAVSPVVRECLQVAQADIAFLAGSGEEERSPESEALDASDESISDDAES
jgi:hypothetical protein